MRSTCLPFRYLGSYLHKGINRARYCGSLLQHIDDRLQGWHSRLLSPTGCLVLLRSVLSSLPLHILAAGGLPKSVINIIGRKMATFYWGRRHHWVAWSSITNPREEGGLGLRDLTLLQQAYHCRIWWTYQQNNTLWSQYMHIKYGGRQDYLPRLFDSPVWKLICRIHSICHTQTQGQGSFLTWTPSPSGEFTLRSAYDICRDMHPTQLSTKFIWYKHHSPAIQLFLWRLFHYALPFEDFIGKYISSRPTQCLFCKNASATMDHIFMLCEGVRPLWNFFAHELHCPPPSSLHLRQFLLSWWYRSMFTSLFGVFKIIVPAIILYRIWRTYTSLVYGDQHTFVMASLRVSV